MKTTDRAVRVAIADAQYLSRAGLCELLSDLQGFVVSGQPHDLEQLAQHIPGCDIVAIDPASEKFQSPWQVVSRKASRPRVLIISDDNSRENIFAALGHNVSGYLTKSCDKEEIQSAFRAIARGERFFCNQILEVILERHTAVPEDNCKPSRLSVREVEIVRLVAEGLTTNAIAHKLHLSPHTVYTHRKNIMRKVKVNSAPELVLYAVNEGLIATG